MSEESKQIIIGKSLQKQ